MSRIVTIVRFDFWSPKVNRSLQEEISKALTSISLCKRNALSDVTACLRERLHRWQHIERICGFPIIRNPGLPNLTALLYSDSLAAGFPRVPQPSHLWHGPIHGSMEDLLEESSAAMLSQISGEVLLQVLCLCCSAIKWSDLVINLKSPPTLTPISSPFQIKSYDCILCVMSKIRALIWKLIL